MDYQIVDLTLSDGGIIRDVAISGSTFIGEARRQPDLHFDPADITDIKVTHKKWDFQKERRR